MVPIATVDVYELYVEPERTLIGKKGERVVYNLDSLLDIWKYPRLADCGPEELRAISRVLSIDGSALSDMKRYDAAHRKMYPG